MRRRAAGLVAVLVAAGLGACGNGGAEVADAGGRPKLPGSTAGGGMRSSTAAMAAEDSAAPSALLAPVRPVEYRLAAGAVAPAEEAPAYALEPAGAGAAERLAKALGVDAVQLQDDRLFWHHDSSAPDGAVSSGSVTSSCATGEACPEPAPIPRLAGALDDAEATSKAASILAAAGVESDGGRFQAFSGGPGTPTSVTFTPAVGGTPVQGLQTTITFGAEGKVLYGNGFLGTLEEVGTYPLIDLAEAVDRLRSDGGSGGFRTMEAPVEDGAATATDSGPATTIPDDGSASGSTGSTGAAGGAGSAGTGSAGAAGSGAGAPAAPGCEPGTPCTVPPSPPTDEPRMTIEPQPPTPTVPLEPEVLEITGAELVLQVTYPTCPGETIYLVPAYRLLPQDIAVAAVVDGSLAPAGEANGTGEACAGRPGSDLPVGKPEPAPLPPEAGTEPARP